ncbi:MAG: hypothetical protein GVY11_08290 [Gammaproteobacteria bacterium]|jgi:competence ComEA-like helix-hairpin-helix protein|nr:hypothetical protein [Gammaproteobacteria bacterium]
MPRRITPLDINTVTTEELQAFEGIGPSVADAIADYRETNGPFTAVGQLELVPEVAALPPEMKARLKEAVGVRPRPGAGETAPATRLDLNRATIDELKVIKGLGEGRAEEIVKARSLSGGFAGVDALPLIRHLTDSEKDWIKSHLFVM